MLHNVFFMGCISIAGFLCDWSDDSAILLVGFIDNSIIIIKSLYSFPTYTLVKVFKALVKRMSILSSSNVKTSSPI